MAMVLDAFASYVQSTVMEMVNEEVGMLLGVPGEIEKMGVKLGDLKNFLADADKRNITDNTVQEWVGQLKGAMYEITDILDICQLKAMERPDLLQPVVLLDICCNPLLFCLRNPLHAHDIGIRIKTLNQKLDAIKERSAAFSFINLGPNEDGRSGMHASRLAATRETSGELDRSGLVGEKIEEDTRRLVEIMVTRIDGDNSRADNIISVFAIVGVGGIGKTTLARKIFNDEAIQRDFETKIWLSVNQGFNEAELLRRAISGVGGNHQPAGTSKDTLQQILKNALRGKKIFMVMDDVWDQKVWEELRIPFVNVVAEGSRILVTTRDERVARGMKAVRPYHKIYKLDDEDGWLLLKKQVVSSETDGPQIDMLKDIGLQIIEKCGGLPLAVKVMGGLLCQKDIHRRDWESVLNDSIWSVTQELNSAVYLSYQDLPPCIKQCFLYYSLLAKSAVFLREEIIGMWISEGFLHGASDDLEELGSKYHKELILRNLIEPDTSYVDQRVCKMHDVVRSFAQFVARHEALATHGGETSTNSKLSAQKFLRLSIESKISESDGLDWSSLRTQNTVRTLISVGHINLTSGDTLVNFPCLRILHISSLNIDVLVGSLHQLKHLRYLSIQRSDISSLPDNIGDLKFLQHISLFGCKQFVKLPHSIVKLGQLRFLNFRHTSIKGIPRGFRVLTNLRTLLGFPAHVDGDWCSLEELGPLYQLKALKVEGLENVSAISSAQKARLAEKTHLTELLLTCSSRVGDDGLIKEEGVSEEEQGRIKEVFDQLCPPPNIYNLDINGYFGGRLPRWMMSTSSSSFESLRILFMTDLACCTQLPDGLSRLSCLEFIQIDRAPSIKRVGPEFLQPYHHNDPCRSQAAAAFPRLGEMNLLRLVEWEEWEWEKQVPAMPMLETLLLDHCKLRCIPPGLASNVRALRILDIQFVEYLSYLENFASVVELGVQENPDLERITNLPSLQKLQIDTCPKLKVLEGVPALHKLILEDYTMETLPEYMRRDVKPRHLELRCSLPLLTSIAAGQSDPEWDKFSHVDHVKAYASDGNNKKKWYVLYTRETCSLDTNVSRSSMSRGTLLSSMLDAQGFESVFKMRRRTFDYICNLVDEDMMARDSSYTFVDRRVLSLEDRVAVALIALNSGEPMSSLGSSVGVNESTVTLVTERFVEAMLKRADHHISWLDTSEMEKIKFKFDNIHGLPNCCGVVHTAHITFGQTRDHEKDDSILMQAVVDPDMRFTNIWLGSSDMSQMSLLCDSWLFKKCEEGEILNGGKVKASPDGSVVGEYMIGDAGYPLLPWLLTPYQENDLLGSKVEFNIRHSAATTAALKALARLKDTWKCLHGGMWHLKRKLRGHAIRACWRLHNIVIDLEDLHMSRDHQVKYSKQVRRLGDEDAIRARDILSQHLITISSESRVSGVEEEIHSPVSGNLEEDQQIASQDKEEEAHARTAEEIVLAT